MSWIDNGCEQIGAKPREDFAPYTSGTGTLWMEVLRTAWSWLKNQWRRWAPPGGPDVPVEPDSEEQSTVLDAKPAATPGGEELGRRNPEHVAQTDSEMTAPSDRRSSGQTAPDTSSMPGLSDEDDDAERTVPVPSESPNDGESQQPAPAVEPPLREETPPLSTDESRSPEKPAAEDVPKPRSLDDLVPSATRTKRRRSRDEGPRQKGEPWRFGARRIRPGGSGGSVPSEVPYSPPELRCRRAGGVWEIVLRTDPEAEVTEVRQGARALEVEGPDSNEYRPENFCVEVRLEMKDGVPETVPLFGAFDSSREPLVFRLSRHGEDEHGRQCRTLTRGLYLVIAPKSWNRAQRQFREPEPCHDDRFSAHFFYPPDDALKDAGRLGGWSPQADHSARLAEGETVFDSSDDGAIYVGDLPGLEDTQSIEWARVGEERAEGWKGQGFRVAKWPLCRIVAGRRGRFFLRTYRPDETALADSSVFRYWPDLAEILVNESPFERHSVFHPSSSGYGDATIRLLNSQGEAIIPRVLSAHASSKPDGTVVVPPACEADHVRLRLGHDEAEMNVDVVVPRIWWRVSSKEEWRDKPLELTRDEFTDGNELEVIVPESVDSLRADTGHEFDRKFPAVRCERTRRRSVVIPLVDFRDDEAVRGGETADSSLRIRVGSHELTVVIVEPTPPRGATVPGGLLPTTDGPEVVQPSPKQPPPSRPALRKRTRGNPLLNGVKHVDWKDVDFLREFLTDRGRIQPRRVTGARKRIQRQIRKAVKRARQMALVPYE